MSDSDRVSERAGDAAPSSTGRKLSTFEIVIERGVGNAGGVMSGTDDDGRSDGRDACDARDAAALPGRSRWTRATSSTCACSMSTYDRRTSTISAAEIERWFASGTRPRASAFASRRGMPRAQRLHRREPRLEHRLQQLELGELLVERRATEEQLAKDAGTPRIRPCAA